MLLTGLRLEEVILIEWRDVTEENLHVRAAVAKGGKKRDVDLSIARTALATQRGEPTDRIFPFSFGQVRGIYRRSGVDWTPHLRAGVVGRGHPAPARGDGRTDFLLGARAPFGFSLMFNAPFDVFAELVAGVWFVEDPRVHVDAALGARYWF